MILVLCLAVMTLAEPGQGGAVGGIRMTPPATQGPARDTSAAKGTGAIKGKVVATETGKPMRRVQISLSSPDISEARTISSTASAAASCARLART